MPRPSTAMNSAVRALPVSMSKVDSSTMPTTMISPPSTGKIRYRPVRVINWPARSEVTSTPPIIGSSNRPEFVAEAPCTTCWYRGR